MGMYVAGDVFSQVIFSFLLLLWMFSSLQPIKQIKLKIARGKKNCLQHAHEHFVLCKIMNILLLSISE